MVSRVGVAGLVILSLVLAGCGSDDDGGTTVGGGDSSVGATTTAPGDGAPDDGAGAGEEEDSGEAHTFIFPTTAQVNEAFGGDYAVVGGADCTATFAKGVQGCSWERTPLAVADGVHSFRVSCDFRLPAKADPKPEDWVVEIVAANDGSESVDSLPVPAVFRFPGGDSPENSDVDLSSVFAVEGQKPFTVCSMVAAPIYDDGAKVFKNIGREAAKEGLMSLAEEAIQPL